MAQQAAMTKPAYGLDAPGIVRGFALFGPLLAALGTAGVVWNPHWLVATIGGIAQVLGAIFIVEAVLMWWSSRVGKMRLRDRLLDGLHLRGDEAVLDVGCGRGLLLIGAAKRLPHGAATGLDLWSQTDLSDNSPEATLANAGAEGVAARVRVESGDMRRMPFADAAFDAVVASLAIHNIRDREGRRQAIAEIVRVLKPGGQVALQDFQHTGEYADDLRAGGMPEVHISGIRFAIFPPVRVVTGTKPVISGQ